MHKHLALLALFLGLLVSACSGSGDASGEQVTFGANDAQCVSPTLTNGLDDERLLDVAVDCLFDEYNAGTPVIVDVNAATIEGDPIFIRYDYDGETVLIIEDDRLDAFGGSEIRTKRCLSIRQGNWLPEGVECETADHPGFTDANR